MTRQAATLVLLAALAACAAPRAPLELGADAEGKLDILGPTPALVAAGLPGDWHSLGHAGPGQARVVELDGVPALRLVSGGTGFLLARRIESPLFMTPYLSWSWNMETHGPGLHPVRLIVGFEGGANYSAGETRPASPDAALPPHDRSFAIAWADSALRRGSFVKPDDFPRRAPLYIARGGNENAGAWWFETIDLDRAYRELWPGDDSTRVRVVFIGLAVSSRSGSESAIASANPPTAYVSGIRLSR